MNKKNKREKKCFKVVHVLHSGFILFQEENNKIWVVMYFLYNNWERETDRDRDRDRKRWKPVSIC